ncbi:MAG: hypothetical protein ACREBU_03770 [Nitrososphaera sp.]
MNDTYATMISGGNFDFKDGGSKGYWLNISLAKYDEVLLRLVVKICRKLGFIFWNSPSSATGFMEQSNLSLTEQARLLEKAKELTVKHLRW